MSVFQGCDRPRTNSKSTVCEKFGLALPWPRWHEAIAHDRIYDSRRRQTCSIFQGDFVPPWARCCRPLAITLAACGPTIAQTQYSDVPVLVAAEDENKLSVRRGSEIFRRIISALRDGMYRKGFRVVDEESVAVDLGWKIKDRRSKMDLIGMAKDLNKSDKATHQVRALFLFRVFAAAESRGGGTRTIARVRINGEINDLVGNDAPLDFETPTKEFPAPADCLKPEQRQLCLDEVVGKHARELAADLGVVMGTKLAHLREVSVGGGRTRPGSGGTGSGSGQAVTGGSQGTRRGSGSGHGLLTPYTVTLRHFERREGLTIALVMAEEFPGYKTHTLISADSATRKYSYITSAKPHKMEEWLTILLTDMNFNPDKEVRIAINGAEITVEKIVPTDQRPRSTDEKARFK